MAGRRTGLGTLVAVLLASAATPAFGISPAKLSGNLGGVVSDNTGRPQMGAAVILFSRSDRFVQRVLTDERGAFGFGSLPPDVYSVRVTLSRFLPAFRDHIYVQAGGNRFLDVSLSSLFSSIQLMPGGPVPTALMTDDWKWALRTSSASRPVTRVLPAGKVLKTSRSSTLFRETRGLVDVSGGEGGSSGRGETDLGTKFALATSIGENNHVQFAGTMGYARASGLPSAAFRSSFSRPFGGFSPKVTVTMQQFYLPGHTGTEVGIDDNGTLPPLRTLSASLHDKTQVSDALGFEYGFEWDAVSFIDRLHYFSPYARMTLQLPRGKLDATYTSGNARPELGMAPASSEDGELLRDLTGLSLVPRVSLENHRVRVQHGVNYEVGLTEPLGKSREVRVSAYRESVTNAALTIAGNRFSGFGGDILPDFSANSSVFNAGNFHSQGYQASVTQHVGSNYQVTLMYGSVGVLTARSNVLTEATANELRELIRVDRRDALTVQADGTLKPSGTHFKASYQWLDSIVGTPAQLYSTEAIRPEPGLDVLIRQPIPSVLSLPGHIQLTAEVRNLLAQGYLPIALPDGRRLVLVNTPRSFRGGVSFSF